jgi:hypothetical protein
MGGVMPTPFDPNRYKIVCEVDLRRSDATITRPPLTLTFREPTTDPGSSVPARSATHTHPTSVSTTNAYPTSVSTVTVNETFESTNTSVAEHSSSLSHIESGWAAFNNAMRRMEETFSRAPFVSDGSSGASNRGNGARDAASHRPTSSINATTSTITAAGLTGATNVQQFSFGHRPTSSINATTSTITAAGLTGATNVQQFSFGHRPTSSINTTTSTITAAGLTGATNVRASVAASPRSNLSANELLEAIHVPLPAQLISGGQGNGASVAETHRTAAGTNAPSSVLTAAELSGARRPQPPIPTIPALPWYEIARPQLPTQNPTNHTGASTLQPLVLSEAPGAGVAAPFSTATDGGISGSAGVQNYPPTLGVAYSGNAASVSVAVPQVAGRRVTRQSSSSATVPSSDSVAPRRSTRVKRPAPV